MSKRTDIHRPSAIIPSDYEWVGQEVAPIAGLGDAQFILAERARIRAHMLSTGGTYSDHEHGGNCMVCGSVNAIYTHLFHHAKSNTYVRFGSDCAMKCEMSWNDDSVKRFRRAVENAREAKAGKRKAIAILSDHGLDAAWAIVLAGPNGEREESIVIDIVGKLSKYGSVSEKQINFIRVLLDKIATRSQRKATREEQERQRRASAPSWTLGRQQIVGTIKSARFEEAAVSFHITADRVRGLVLLDDGRKVWTSIPREIWDVEGVKLEALRGQRVCLVVTIDKLAEDDPTMAFGKRPSIASEVEPEPTPKQPRAKKQNVEEQPAVKPAPVAGEEPPVEGETKQQAKARRARNRRARRAAAQS